MRYISSVVRLHRSLALSRESYYSVYNVRYKSNSKSILIGYLVAIKKNNRCSPCCVRVHIDDVICKCKCKLILTCKMSWMNMRHGQKMTYTGEAEIWCAFCCVWWCRWLEMSGVRGQFEFQMTGAASRKEQEPKLVSDGVGTRQCWSEERRERTGWW